MYFRTQCYMQDVDSFRLYCSRERSSAIIMKMSESLCHKLEAFPWWCQLPIRYQYWISNRKHHMKPCYLKQCYNMKMVIGFLLDFKSSWYVIILFLYAIISYHMKPCYNMMIEYWNQTIICYNPLPQPLAPIIILDCSSHGGLHGWRRNRANAVPFRCTEDRGRF